MNYYGNMILFPSMWEYGESGLESKAKLPTQINNHQHFSCRYIVEHVTQQEKLVVNCVKLHVFTSNMQCVHGNISIYNYV